MAIGYLVLASERRVIIVQFDGGDQHGIERTIGTTTVEHGTTLWTEDQLIIGYDEQDAAPGDQFWVAGVPFPFYGSGLLVGTDPMTGDTAERPALELDEFRRLVSFTSHTGVRRAAVMEAPSNE